MIMTQLRRLIAISAALVICATIFFLVSLLYGRVGAVATKVKDASKPLDGVVYVMTFKNSGPLKPKPSWRRR